MFGVGREEDMRGEEKGSVLSLRLWFVGVTKVKQNGLSSKVKNDEKEISKILLSCGAGPSSSRVKFAVTVPELNSRFLSFSNDENQKKNKRKRRIGTT